MTVGANQREIIDMGLRAKRGDRLSVTSHITERIETLEGRLRQLKAKQQRIEARRRSLESQRTRRDDTRRKILVGAIVLAKVEQDVIHESVLRDWLSGALTRADDRALFGL